MLSSRCLGLLVLSSLCSAMTTAVESDQSPALDPDDTYWSGSDVMAPPTGQSDNTTSGPDRLQLLDFSRLVVPPIPDPAICNMLLNAPVPVPINQIPVFCLCSHCKGTVGLKGDRGDRGPPGT